MDRDELGLEYSGFQSVETRLSARLATVRVAHPQKNVPLSARSRHDEDRAYELGFGMDRGLDGGTRVSAEAGARDWTYAGASVETALTATSARQLPATLGSTIHSANGAHIRILWPPKSIEPPTPASLILQIEYQNHRILLLEPAAANALALVLFNDPTLTADAAILLGPEPSPKAATSLRELIARTGATASSSGAVVGRRSHG